MNFFPALKYIFSMFTAKTSVIILGVFTSTVVSILVDKIKMRITDDVNTVPIIVLTGLSAFMLLATITDLFTGILASRKEKEEIKSKKLSVTISKVFGLFMYSTLAGFILIFSHSPLSILIVALSPLFLSILREYVSIGENLARISGEEKGYIFKMVDRIFDLLEGKFLKVLKNKVESVDEKIGGKED